MSARSVPSRPALAILLTAGLVGGLATPASAQNATAHRGAAERAFVKERWCEAVYLYTKLDELEGNAEWALQAADAAHFADDRARALRLYESAIARAPKHRRARPMQQSNDALTKAIAKRGEGTACVAPAPECGNGVLESGESCDDGNRASGDACPDSCAGGSTAPAGPVAPGPVASPPAADAPSAAVAAPLNEVCTLIRPVKMFNRGEWKTLEFGATVTVQSRGPQWTMVDTPMGAGKIASSAIEGACSKEPVLTTEPAPSDAPIEVEAEPVSEPEPEPDPEPAVEEPPAPAVEEPAPARPDMEPLRQDIDPAAVAPEVEGAGGLGGWIMVGVGAALAVGGASAAVWGSLPYFEYTALCETPLGDTSCPAIEALGEDYAGENDDDDRAKVADEANDLRGRVDNAAQAWDSGGSTSLIPTGRFVTGGGAIAAGLGVGLIVGGLVWALAGGGEPTEQETAEGE